MAYIALLPETELLEAQVRCIQTEIGRIVLARVAGQIHAFEDRCSHDDGPLAGGKLEGHCIHCPRHGASFDIRNGSALQLPATEDIEIFAVRVVNGQVEVDLA
ncbi:MAG: non-heme iron oxygenase ferredoxin subunit [Leptospirales bacterium]|nr:non-heme iron oxygenase ferredoxin subunit [Leptospirales bacterium]